MSKMCVSFIKKKKNSFIAFWNLSCYDKLIFLCFAIYTCMTNLMFQGINSLIPLCCYNL